MSKTLPVDRAVNAREPLFILAPARSYSTVSVALLSGHPGIYGFPELQIFDAGTVGDLRWGNYLGAAHLPDEWKKNQWQGIVRAVAEVAESDQGDEVMERGEKWLAERQDWATTRLMDHLLDSVAPCIGLEKSPATVAYAGAFERCRAAYPLARYIHLTRHPVTTMWSMMRNFRSLGPEHHRPSSCLKAWYGAHTRIISGLAGVPPERWLRVRAEDLLGDSQSHVIRILQWLGLASDAATVRGMRRTQEWVFSGSGPSGYPGGGDAKFFADPELRTIPAAGPVEFDPSWGFGKRTKGEATRLAGFLGYY